jgi:hypothetical protein
MLEVSAWLKFVVAALATWRVTHLIAHEDGPWNLIAKTRKRVGSGFLGQLMDCFYCVSLWVAGGVTLLLGPNLRDGVLLWLALSGAACLLDRLGRDPVVVQTFEKGEE